MTWEIKKGAVMNWVWNFGRCN